MIVREAMSPEVETARPSQSVEEIAELMAKKGIGYLPVCNRGLLVGIITDRDITCRVVADRRRPQATKVADVMSKEVASCFDDDDLTTAIHLMEQNRVRRIPVVDRDERLVGVLSLTDIAAPSAASGHGGDPGGGISRGTAQRHHQVGSGALGMMPAACGSG
jgi:CBS domain-containing protein